MRTLREVLGGQQPQGHIWFGTKSFGLFPGASAEVTGITSTGLLGHGQRGVLVIIQPGTRPQAVKLDGKNAVATGLTFAARYTAECAALAAQ